MKERTPHRVALSDRALEVLHELRDLNPSSPFIFPGPGTSGYISEAGIRNMMKSYEGGENGSIHGFRASFRTWAEEMTHFSHAMKEMALAHKVGTDVERAYQRSDLVERRFEMMNAWASYCNGDDAAQDAGDGNVIQFRA